MIYCAWGVAGVAFILWVRLLEDHPPGLISIFVFPTPLFGVLFSALLFGESLNTALVVGVIAVALGILIVTWDRGRKEATEAFPEDRSPAKAA